MINRRQILQQLAGFGGAGLFMGSASTALALPGLVKDQIDAPIQPWRPGSTDIHFIATGRGDATLMILPDGTSILMDAGSVTAPAGLTHSDPLPDGTRRPGEWIARYIQRHVSATGDLRLNFALITHFHEDHMGAVPKDQTVPDHGFIHTGISDVAALVPIDLLIDRGFPDYNFPIPQTSPAALNYRAFIAQRLANGARVEQFRVGASDQIGPCRQPASAAGIEIRNIAGNGRVWTGRGATSREIIAQNPASPVTLDENSCSLAIRLRHGAFRFYAAGDLSANDFDGTAPYRALGNAAALAAGPVSVAAAPHHGMFDGLSGQAVRALQPRLWLLSTWHAVHPNMETLERIYNTNLYKGPRDVMATALTPANAAVNGRLTDRFLSSRGHVVVRVAPDGTSFHVCVTDAGSETDQVKNIFGPWFV